MRSMGMRGWHCWSWRQHLRRRRIRRRRDTAINHLQQRLGFRIVRTALQFFLQLAGRPAGVSVLEQRNCEIKPIIGIVRIGGHSLREVLHGCTAASAPRIHYAKIVVHLGQRQSGREITECGVRAVEVSAVILRHAQKKRRLPSDRSRPSVLCRATTAACSYSWFS